MKRKVLIIICTALAAIQLHAHVDLNYPQGGEVFNPGDIVNIRWTETVRHNTLNWDLYYSADGGQTWTALMEDIPLEVLTFQWTVPDAPGMDARIRIVQDNENGNYSSSSLSFTIASFTGVGESFEAGEIKVYPNPLTEQAILEFNKPEYDYLTLNIYNSQGRLVRSIQDNASGRIELRKGGLPAGYYFLRLGDGRQILSSGKLVIR